MSTRRTVTQILCVSGVLATVAVLLVATIGPGDISTDEPSPKRDDSEAMMRVDRLADAGDCGALLEEYEAAWDEPGAGEGETALVYYIEDRIFALGCDNRD